MMGRGELIVLSGPSGSGKTTICERLLEGDDQLERVITCTTRDLRGDEVNGVDYHFLSHADFEEGIAAGKFLEHAEVYGNYYGTPRKQIDEGIRNGKRMLLNIDVQGARQLREAKLEAMNSIFIDVPDLETLERRLRARGTDAEDVIQARLNVAKTELEEKSHYDHVVVNAKLESAVDEIRRKICHR